MKHAHAHFAIKGWDEKPYSEGHDLPKMTRASVTKTYTGDIDATGHVEYLMMYRSDGSATFVGAAEDNPVNPRVNEGTGTHHAWLLGYIQITVS